MKKTVAVLLTVFNRKDVILRGLATLYVAMKPVEGEYSFDVYMTDDGCTNGTLEAVTVKEWFPGNRICRDVRTILMRVFRLEHVV